MIEEETRAADESRGDDDPTEVAGETTAAATVSGPADTRPVGTGTMADVADQPAADETAKASGAKHSKK